MIKIAVAFLDKIHWISGAAAFAVCGTVIFLCLPPDMQSMDQMPWYVAWVTLPAFFLFALVCIILRIDFVSNRPPSEGLNAVEVVWIGAIFVVLFMAGALLIMITKRLVNRKRVDPAGELKG